MKINEAGKLILGFRAESIWNTAYFQWYIMGQKDNNDS
jgi:hypothetical protein